MKKIITTEDILNNRTFFTEEQADNVRENIAKKVAKIKTGRKPAVEGNSRNLAIKVSKDTKEAINYAYSIGVVINLEDIKLLQYAKEHGLTLSKLQEA